VREIKRWDGRSFYHVSQLTISSTISSNRYLSAKVDEAIRGLVHSGDDERWEMVDGRLWDGMVVDCETEKMTKKVWEMKNNCYFFYHHLMISFSFFSNTWSSEWSERRICSRFDVMRDDVIWDDEDCEMVDGETDMINYFLPSHYHVIDNICLTIYHLIIKSIKNRNAC